MHRCLRLNAEGFVTATADCPPGSSRLMTASNDAAAIPQYRLGVPRTALAIAVAGGSKQVLGIAGTGPPLAACHLAAGNRSDEIYCLQTSACGAECKCTASVAPNRSKSGRTRAQAPTRSMRN